MKRKVYISGLEYMLPDISCAHDLRACYNGEIHQESLEKYRGFTFDKTDPLYPSKKDIKSMRPDVIASSLCVKKLLEHAGIDSTWLENTPLFLASGLSLDSLVDQINRMAQEYLPLELADSAEQQNNRLVKALHPLFILKSLSNAGTCYIAQGSNVKGTNTTLASTSHSGFYALEMGVESIAYSEHDMAVVGVTSDSGAFSDTTLQLITQGSLCKKGSSCAVFFILESEESLSQRNKEPLCEIKALINPPIVPDIYSHQKPLPYDGINEILGKNRTAGQMVLFTGGYTDEDYVKQCSALKEYWDESFSWFTRYHNFGAGGLLVHLATAVTLLQEKSHSQIDCVDIDPYGRECGVSIKRNREIS